MISMSEWLESTNVKCRSEKVNVDARKADEWIKYCPTCKKCWEFDRFASRCGTNRSKGYKIYMYYNNFPIYGKEKKVCNKCKED